MIPKKASDPSNKKYSYESLIIHDILAVSRYKKYHPRLGEYIFPKKLDSNYFSASTDFYIGRIKRIHQYIESLILEASDQHRFYNYVNNKLKFKNNITRLVTNEFLFYTKKTI